jgi:hypothetical protein
VPDRFRIAPRLRGGLHRPAVPSCGLVFAAADRGCGSRDEAGAGTGIFLNLGGRANEGLGVRFFVRSKTVVGKNTGPAGRERFRTGFSKTSSAIPSWSVSLRGHQLVNREQPSGVQYGQPRARMPMPPENARRNGLNLTMFDALTGLAPGDVDVLAARRA